MFDSSCQGEYSHVLCVNYCQDGSHWAFTSLVDAITHLSGDVTVAIYSYQTQVLKGHITMACKPKLAMEKLLAKEDFFIRAVSTRVLVDELVWRHGGSKEVWGKLVIEAIDDGALVFTEREGVIGYRTLQSSERAVLNGASPSPVCNLQMAVA